jgi:hypothetical protein
MNSDAFKDIEKLESDLWGSRQPPSQLQAYFMPVLGVIFLRHAANRFESAHRQIEADRASGKMPKRKVLPADYIARRSLYLPEKARFDWIMQQAAVRGANLSGLPRSRSVGCSCGRRWRRSLSLPMLSLLDERAINHDVQQVEGTGRVFHG